mgnify:CR=1 FL=1
MDVRLAFLLSRAEEALPRLQALGLGAEVYLDPALLEEDALFQSLRRRLPGRVSVHLPFWNLDLLSPDPEVRGLTLRRPGRRSLGRTGPASTRGSPTAAPRRGPWSGPCPWRRPWGWWCGGPAPWGCASSWRTATSPARRS